MWFRRILRLLDKCFVVSEVGFKNQIYNKFSNFLSTYHSSVEGNRSRTPNFAPKQKSYIIDKRCRVELWSTTQQNRKLNRLQSKLSNGAPSGKQKKWLHMEFTASGNDSRKQAQAVLVTGGCLRELALLTLNT